MIRLKPEELKPLPQFTVRDMLVNDMHCLMADYIKHYRPMMKGHQSEIYSVGMQKRFARMARMNNVLLAVDADPKAFAERRDILGWLIFKRWDTRAIIVHYIYIKKSYREQGLSKALLAAAGWREGLPIIASHKYRIDRRIVKKHKILINEFILEEISEWPQVQTSNTYA